jgi:hypothetical protein
VVDDFAVARRVVPVDVDADLYLTVPTAASVHVAALATVVRHLELARSVGTEQVVLAWLAATERRRQDANTARRAVLPWHEQPAVLAPHWLLSILRVLHDDDRSAHAPAASSPWLSLLARL